MCKITAVVSEINTSLKYPTIIAHKENGQLIQFPWFCVENYALLTPDLLTSDGYPLVGSKLYLEEQPDGRYYPDGNHYTLRRTPLHTTKTTRHMSEDSLSENLVPFTPQSLSQLWECIYKCIPNLDEASIREAFKISRMHESQQRERLLTFLDSRNERHFIPLQEGLDVEFKTSFVYTANSKKDRMAQYRKLFNTLCAFANSESHKGCIFVGVDDCGNVRDLKQEMLEMDFCKTRTDFERDFKNIFGIYTKNETLAQSVDFTWCVDDESQIFCVINLPEYNGPIVFAGPTQDVYVRQGSATRLLTGPALTDYILNRQ